MIGVVIDQDRTVVLSGKPRHNYARVRAFAMAGAVLGAIWFAPSLAAAQVINACVRKDTGALRISNTCNKHETALSWNVQGPPGTPGVQGKQGTQGIQGIAGPPGPSGSLNPTANVQQLNLVNASNQVLATLGSNATDGTFLAFFDPSGNVTLGIGNTADGTGAGMSTYDGNSIFPGTGVARTSFGETNASGAFPGLGFIVLDGSGKERARAGTSTDLTTSNFFTVDANGSVAGIGYNENSPFKTQGFFTDDLNGKSRAFVGNTLDGTTINEAILVDPNGSVSGIEDDNSGGGSQGFFANDLNGKNRVFAGNSLDGTTFQQINFGDKNGNFAGLLGFNTSVSGSISLGMGLLLADPSGSFFAGENLDGAGVNWTLLDTSSTFRAFGTFDGSNESVELLSPTSVEVGHLP
jgi:hypothetical protein